MTQQSHEQQAPNAAKLDKVLHAPASRRRFLRWGALSAASVAGAGTLAACASSAPIAPPPTVTIDPAAASTATTDKSGGAGSHVDHAPVAAQTGETAWQEMDRMHEEGVKAFPAKTEGLGMQPLPHRVENGVKVFEITCKKVQWEVSPGQKMEAWTYNGQLPGPEIRVVEGDRVKLIVKNELDESTAVHLHGVMLPNNMDGVPFITQPPITPGSSFTYEFVARNPGSHMYHAHHNSTKQVSMGLLGPFIIEQKDRSKDPAYDKEYTIVLNDTAHGFTLNGKGFPATQPLTAKLGEKVRIRYMNEGVMIHPMHLHGLPQLVFAKDGWNLPEAARFMCDTINVAPGERWDVIVDCTDPGVWAFHCHILPHAENHEGMFGMVTALIVAE